MQSNIAKNLETVRSVFDLAAASGEQKIALLRKLCESFFPQTPTKPDGAPLARIDPETTRAVRALFKLAARDRKQGLALLAMLTEHVIPSVNRRADLMVELLILRGVQRGDPVDEEGGSVSAEVIGGKLGGIAADTVSRWRRSGKLLAWKQGAAYRYPVFQIADGAIIAGIPETIAEMEKIGIENPRAQVLELLHTLTDRNGKPRRAIDLLRKGRIEEACDLIIVNRSR